MNGRRLKRRVIGLLESQDFFEKINQLRGDIRPRVINVLFSTLISQDERIKWHSVTAMGILISDQAKEDMESARNIMRRLMWSLNDESGSIGWGAPEAMGEIMACHEGLAGEFAPLHVSYIRKDGNFLEYEPLQRGAVWGIGRLAQVRPGLLKPLGAVDHLLPYLDSRDAGLRGLTAWVVGLLDAGEARDGLENLLADSTEIKLYTDRRLVSRRVSDLAEEALSRIEDNELGSFTARVDAKEFH